MRASSVPLKPHPSHADHGVDGISVSVKRSGAGLHLDYHIIADPTGILLPKGPGGERRDELWKHTCLEAFVRLEAANEYLEFNFAPNGDWAGYEFDGYRQNGRDLTVSAPRIDCTEASHVIRATVTLPTLPELYQSNAIQLGFSVVIETPQNDRFYWAMFHPNDRPDFHRIENFQISLD